MNKILFLCSGNVGRSQIAEAYFNKYTKDGYAISAGVDPLTPNKYPKLPNEVIDLMNEEGIDVSVKKVKYVNESMLSGVDQVIVLCDIKLCPQFIQNSKNLTYWNINDPYNTSTDNFRTIRNQIKLKVLKLLNK